MSDVVFRRIARRWGADFVVTEMVAAHEWIKGSEEARLRAEGAGISPHVVQLVGREAGSMAEGARLAEASGADVVDINMGCPAKRVTGGLAGSALMRDPDLALAIVSAVVAAVSVPVTLKMRLGWDDAHRNAPEIARRAEEAGVQAVIVHGRTRQQLYAGKADWRAIGEVREVVGLPVIANGDVVDVASARACLAQSGAAGLMVGRAALGQPWLVGQISAGLRGEIAPAPDGRARSDMAAEHYEGLLGLYGRELGRRHARKHLAAYADRARDDGYAVDPADRTDLVTSDDPSRVLRLIARLFAAGERRAA